jgi:hypothetical protein
MTDGYVIVLHGNHTHSSGSRAGVRVNHDVKAAIEANQDVAEVGKHRSAVWHRVRDVGWVAVDGVVCLVDEVGAGACRQTSQSSSGCHAGLSSSDNPSCQAERCRCSRKLPRSHSQRTW